MSAFVEAPKKLSFRFLFIFLSFSFPFRFLFVLFSMEHGNIVLHVFSFLIFFDIFVLFRKRESDEKS